MSEKLKRTWNVSTGLVLTLACVSSALSLLHLWDYFSGSGAALGRIDRLLDYCLWPALAVIFIIQYFRQRSSEKASR
jgi:hypothetical protein